MIILLDAMSGDNAPLEIIRGASMAAKEYEHTIKLVGDTNVISDIAVKNDIDLTGVEFINAPDVITMEDKAMEIVRTKKESSMAIGLRTLAEGGGDAFVSAGNTGALLTGATLMVKRIPGINRPGIATLIPFEHPVLLMDAGANLTVNSDNLYQFAFMGAKYMEKIYGMERPRIGLLNNGTEYNKGNQLQVDTYALLKESGLNFVGNVEAKSVPFHACDVLITDGYTGNIFLKGTEGMAKYMLGLMKELFGTNFMTKISTLTMRDKILDLKRRFDTSEHGGAPLLGISRPVIKAHGSSDAKAIKNAVRQAISFVNGRINDDITAFAVDYDDKKMLADIERMYGG